VTDFVDGILESRRLPQKVILFKLRNNIFEPKIAEVLRSKTPPKVPGMSGVLPSKRIEGLKIDAR
jgi:hypothetical protein